MTFQTDCRVFKIGVPNKNFKVKPARNQGLVLCRVGYLSDSLLMADKSLGWLLDCFVVVFKSLWDHLACLVADAEVSPNRLIKFFFL